MTDEKNKELILSIGRLFLQLPDERSQFDMLHGLTELCLRKTEQTGLVVEWLDQASAIFKSTTMICNAKKIRKTGKIKS